MKEAPDFGLDFVGGAAGVEQLDAVWIGGGELSIGGADPLVKFGRLLFHAVGRLRDRADAAEHAMAGGFDVDVEEEGQIGAAGADGELIELRDDRGIEAAGGALVNGGGIVKAIGDNERAGGEGGRDHFAHELAPARFEKEQLGLRRHGRAFGRELEEVANFFPDRRPARLAREEKAAPGFFETGREPLHLGGFPTALRALEGDEEPGCHPPSLKHGAPVVESPARAYQLAMKNYWLVKQEPAVYAWEDFVAEGRTAWTGVRNFSARNNLRAMRAGDRVLFYHSVTEKAVVGVAEVARAAYPDPTAEEGDWSAVDLVPKKTLRRTVALDEIKQNRALKEMALLRLSRLSVQPVTKEQFDEILKLAAT